MPGGSSFTVTDPRAPQRVVDQPIARITNALDAAVTARTPARTGRLRAGWRVTRQGDAHYTLSNDVPYAKYVEFGTRNMRAQPMLAPATLAARQRYGR